MGHEKIKLYIISLLILMGVFVLVACDGAKVDDAASEAETDSEGEESTSSGEGLELRVVTAFPESDVLSLGYTLFKEYIDENTNDISVSYVGGPEAIPPFELGEAVRNQVVDIIVTPAAYYSDAVPEGLLLSYSELTTEEEISGGAIDYLDEIHQDKLNAKLLGRGSEVKFNFFTKEEINSIEDFNGLNIRGTATYRPFIEALRSELITMEGGEIYTSLQRGVIDGYGWGHLGITSEGLHEMTDYIIKPDFYHMDVVLAMNLDKWNDLNEELQATVMEAVENMQTRLIEEEAAWAEEELAVFEESGIEVIELGEEYSDLAYESAWNWLEQQFPDRYEEMEELFR